MRQYTEDQICSIKQNIIKKAEDIKRMAVANSSVEKPISFNNKDIIKSLELSGDELYIIFKDYGFNLIISKILGKYSLTEETGNFAIFCKEYAKKEHIDAFIDLLMCSDPPYELRHALYKSYFSCDYSILGDLVLSADKNISRYAARHCSQKYFEKALKSKDWITRRTIYERMGFPDSADLMVKDKSANIRCKIAEFLNKDDPRLLALCNDRSSSVLEAIVIKLDKHNLSMLLKNHKVFDSYILERIKRKMES